MRQPKDSLRSQESGRPLAAFFMPEEGVFLYEQAVAFHGEHNELFIRPVALLGQTRDECGESESLCLAKSESEDYTWYTWQLSRTDSGHRDIWQARVGVETAESCHYRLDHQGVLRSQSHTEKVPISETLEYGDIISSAFLRGYVQQELSRVYQAKERSMIALGDLLSRGAHKSRIERQEKIMRSVGFGMLQLYRPPNVVPSQGVVTEEGRKMFLESVQRAQKYQT